MIFHPLLAGLSPPGQARPVHGTPLLEEEPAIWPVLATFDGGAG
ncbi:MAG: hypothetical protein ACT4QG_09580 [Sporichthyaceae bacterium]